MAMFETPQVWPATDFLPTAGIPGNGWSIDPFVFNDGFYNTWRITSPVGTFQALGNERMVEMIREIQAIEQLQSVSRTREFAEAMRDAGQAQLDSAVRVLRNPVSTVASIPRGAGRFLGAVGSSIGNAARGELQTDASAGDAAARLLGIDRAKRALAASLGVNPYSTNPVLQEQLSEVARVQSMGRLAMNLGTMIVVPVGLGNALIGIRVSDALTQDQINSDPRDLAVANRARIVRMGASAADADALMSNPWFDPWTLTAMLNALEQVQGVQMGAFLRFARDAGTETDAFFFMRNAQIMAQFHRQNTPITGLIPLNHTVACQLHGGGLMLPIWLDFAIWTQDAAQAVSNLLASAAASQSSPITVVTTGFFSPIATEQIQSHGIQILPAFFQAPR